MSNLKHFKIRLIYFFSVLIFSVFFYLSGCGNDTVTNNNNNTGPDTNVTLFDSLTIYEYFTSTSMSAADLYNGKVLNDDNTAKDINLRDSNGLGSRFFFRSGDMSLNPIGKKCDFNSHYDNLTKSQFDTLSKIWGATDTLTVSNFPYSDTRQWGYFNSSQGQGRVYEFYLEGKFPSVTTHQVFGLLYLNGGTPGGPTGYRQVISVKINTDGHNHFVK